MKEDEQRRLLTRHKCWFVLDASSRLQLVYLLCSARLQKIHHCGSTKAKAFVQVKEEKGNKLTKTYQG